MCMYKCQCMTLCDNQCECVSTFVSLYFIKLCMFSLSVVMSVFVLMSVSMSVSLTVSVLVYMFVCCIGCDCAVCGKLWHFVVMCVCVCCL